MLQGLEVLLFTALSCCWLGTPEKVVTVLVQLEHCRGRKYYIMLSLDRSGPVQLLATTAK